MDGTQEVHRTDAEISRDRCLQAIVGADVETAQALWRAALRYNERARSGRLEISTGSRSHARNAPGEKAAREVKV
jgi:hypothetical protein